MPNVTLPHVPGIKAPNDAARLLRKDVARILKRACDNFPGSQPISFAKRHLTSIQNENFYVCEKSDGIRCLLYLSQDRGNEATFLIDRSNDYFYQMGMHFPVPNDETFKHFHIDTIVDGELVIDDMGKTSERMRYLVFDCLAVDGKHLMEKPLDKRLGYFREFVYEPYMLLCKAFPNDTFNMPFEVAFKEMQFAYAIELMFRSIIPNLKHNNDGLIFTAKDAPYTCGTDSNILKWKPANENSIDFLLFLDFPADPERTDHVLYTKRPIFHLAIWHGGNSYHLYSKAYVPESQWQNFQKFEHGINEAVVECSMDAENRWRILRFRHDKGNGNHYTVVQNILRSIEDGISEDELIAMCPAIRLHWKTREASLDLRIKEQQVDMKILWEKKRKASQEIST